MSTESATKVIKSSSCINAEPNNLWELGELLTFLLPGPRINVKKRSPPLCVQFYAPWCGYCKKLEPIWNEVGLELKISGSPVRVGKMDATAYSGELVEFGRSERY